MNLIGSHALEQVRRAVVRCRRGLEDCLDAEIEPPRGRYGPALDGGAFESLDSAATAHAEAAVRHLVRTVVAAGSDLEEASRQAMMGAIAGARQIGADTIRVTQGAAHGCLAGAWQAGGNLWDVAHGVMSGTIDAARQSGLRPADLASTAASALVDAAHEVGDETAYKLGRALCRSVEGVAVAVRSPRQVPPQLREP
jgi:hypothetical protein